MKMKDETMTSTLQVIQSETEQRNKENKVEQILVQTHIHLPPKNVVVSMTL